MKFKFNFMFQDEEGLKSPLPFLRGRCPGVADRRAVAIHTAKMKQAPACGDRSTKINTHQKMNKNN